MKSVTG